MLVIDWFKLEAAQHSISHTQLNYLLNSTMEEQVPPNEEQDPWLSMDTCTPSTEEAERGTGDVPTDCKERAVTTEEDELISVKNLHDHEPTMLRRQ